MVTHDPEGYAFYEAKFRRALVTRRMVEEEMAQVQAAGLACHTYGFFSRAGLEEIDEKNVRLIALEQLYE